MAQSTVSVPSRTSVLHVSGAAREVHLPPERVERTLTLLREGTNVNLVGMRSSGRSALVREVAERLTLEGTTVTEVRGLRSLRDRPLSALAAAGIHISPVAGQLPALTSAIASMEDLLDAPRSVLVIDDADDLDPASAGAIVALLSHRPTPVLMTSRPGGRRQTDTSALTAGLRPGVRVTLDPLTFEQVHTLVHQLLPGGVEPTTVARIAAVSGGLPGLVEAVVENGRRDNRLVFRDGLWIARGDLWTTPLSQAVEPLLTDVDDACVDALTLLAFAGTVPLRAARQLVEPETIAALDDRGLLQVLPNRGAPIVGVFPPLLGDYLTHEGSTLRNVVTRERLAEADLEATTSIGEHTGDGGAAVLVQMLAQHSSAEVAARRQEWRSDPDATNGAALVAAMLVAGARTHEVAAVLRDTRVDGADHRGRAELAAWAAFYCASTGGSRDAALGELEAARSAGCTADGILRAAASRVELLVGDVPSARAALLPLVDDDVDIRGRLLLAAAEVEIAAGRPAAALALLDGIEQADGRRAESATVIAGMVRLLSCDVDAAVRDALAGVERGRADLAPTVVLPHAYVAAYGLALQGRAVELSALVSSVLALGSVPAHLTHIQAALLTFAASGAHWQSRGAYARSIVTQASALRGVRGPHPWMVSDVVGAVVAEGPDADAADVLWDLAQERLLHGFIPAGVAAGVAALEHDPCPERAAVLVRAAASTDSSLLSRLAQYGAALATRDIDELGRQQVVLHDAGLRQPAVRTAVARSIELIARGDTALAIVHADAAWSQAGLRGRDLCGLFAPLDQAVNLTTREREVAVAVARGYTTPEIAARMVLSVRTVENHIFSACHKVHVDNREDLARAARTWLTCVRR
ncbi:LuxR family transcriptional regulator [Cellulomonas sp. Root137]|uniref:helix-turn-helix transcriptional regulator n=1 Tax=Cellulomonas sp. Root137 TaxID=1736459 RepID=UPI0006F3A8BB|nr:LuxR family transcriptional regulator [Cellulomonas sp. Root137]KQY47713.1 hypothetical protein ASD18_10570 [Cellulomonas sp. Root137]